MTEHTGDAHRRGTAATHRGLLAAAVTALLTAGCATVGDAVEERWRSRTDYPKCGAVRLAQGERLEQQAAPEIACLRRALEDGRSAELKVGRPTVEGDPVRTYYRVTPQGALELYSDSTDDRYAARDWSFTACHRPEWLPEVSCGD